jgi:hypothetical protein
MTRRIISLLSVVVTIAAITIGVPGIAHAGFTANKIIDDDVFTDTLSMSAGQIDSFLNGYGSSCISPNHGFTAPDPTGYSPSGGYTYGSSVSAGNVIAHAADAYGINPRVLLVTLQKEQSLVTGTAGCSVMRYAGATGYGCPDGGTTHDYSGVNLYSINGNAVTSISGTCVNSSLKVGFSQQVIRAAWLLRFGQERSLGNADWAVIKSGWDNSDDPQSCYGGPMSQGTYRRCPSGSATYYDGYTTIDGQATHIDSGATAALYWYTPHFHGNQSFVSIWEEWFGADTTHVPSFAWRVQNLQIMDAGKNAIIPTDYMHNGDRLYTTVTVKNTGSVTWKKTGPNPTRLGTLNSMNHNTRYCDVTWPSCNRTPALTEATVAPGQTGHFSFYMAVPNNAGTYRGFFEPVLENQSWMYNDAGFNIYVRNTGEYDWRWLYYDAWTNSSKTTRVNVNNVAKNQQFYVEIKVKNVSAITWKKDGPNPANLGTAGPRDRKSAFCTSGWSSSCNRAGAMVESSVSPGDVATFGFNMKAPNTAGEYREYFRPVIEMKGWGRSSANHVFIKVVN